MIQLRYDQHPGAMTANLGHMGMPSTWGIAKDGRPVVPMNESWRFDMEKGDIGPTSYAQWMTANDQWKQNFQQQKDQFQKGFDENKRRHDQVEGRRSERFGMFRDALVGKGPAHEWMSKGLGAGGFGMTSMSSKNSLSRSLLG